MYKFLLAIFLIVLGDTTEEQLVWSEDYRLDWSDFQGVPQDHVDAVAITASGLSSSFSARTSETKLIDFTARVTANFYPQKSWYKPNKVNEIVLAHEQLHFDIAELNARKLRKRIADYKFTLNIKSEMNVLVEQADKDLEIMQTLYDDESNFSMAVNAQKKWQVYVKRELQRLANYK